MLDKERALADSPQRNAPGELTEEGLLVAGEAEQLAGPLGLSGCLAENDPGLGVRKEALSQPLLLRTFLTSCFTQQCRPKHRWRQTKVYTTPTDALGLTLGASSAMCYRRLGNAKAMVDLGSDVRNLGTRHHF